MSTKVRPFLMFQGDAEEAMNFYVSLFPGGDVIDIVRYGPGQAGAEGFGDEGKFLDRTPADRMYRQSGEAQLYLHASVLPCSSNVKSEDHIQRLHSALVDGGESLMPIDNYGFSRRFAWINDRYGIPGS